MNYVFELISANNHQIVMKPKYDVNGLLRRLWFTSDDFLEKNRWPDENFMKKSCGSRKVFKKSSEVNQRRFNISLETYFGFITF